MSRNPTPEWIPLEDAADVLCVTSATLRKTVYRSAIQGVVRREYRKVRAGPGRGSAFLHYGDCEALIEIRRRYRMTLLQAARYAKEVAKSRK